MQVSALHAGLYISLYQCSMSAGLEHCLDECAPLASGEPEFLADLAHLNPGSG